MFTFIFKIPVYILIYNGTTIFTITVQYKLDNEIKRDIHVIEI